MRLLALLLLLLFGCVPSHAQTVMNLDSLLNQLKSSKADTLTVQLYINIGQQYESNDPSLASRYYLKADSLSKEINYLRGRVKFITNYTYILNMQGKYDSSILLNLESVRLSREIGDSMLTAKCLANAGTAFTYHSDYENALKYVLQGERILSKTNDLAFRAQMDDILQNLYHSTRRYDMAIRYGESAVEESRKTGNLNFLGISLLNLATSYVSTKRPDDARRLLEEGLAIATKTGNVNLEASTLSNMSDILLNVETYRMTKPYLERALVLFRTIDAADGECITLRNLSYYYFLDKKYDVAKEFALKALNVANKGMMPAEKRKALIQLSDIAIVTGDLSTYRRLREESDILADSILSTEIQNNISDLEKSYETEKKQAQINQLEDEQKIQSLTIQQSRVFNYVLLTGLILLGIVTYLFWRNYQQKIRLNLQRMETAKAEQALEQRLALEKERTRIATDMHDDLGSSLSRIKFLSEGLAIKDSRKEPIAEEISKIRTYSNDMIGKMGEIVWALSEKNDTLSDLLGYTRSYAAEYLTQHEIDCTFNMPEVFPALTVNGEFRRNIFLAVKETLHNIIKHAKATAVEIDMRTDENLNIRISDNGTGFDKNKVRRYGNGLNNLRTRIEGLGGTFKIDSSSGTEVRLTVPL